MSPKPVWNTSFEFAWSFSWLVPSCPIACNSLCFRLNRMKRHPIFIHLCRANWEKPSHHIIIGKKIDRFIKYATDCHHSCRVVSEIKEKMMTATQKFSLGSIVPQSRILNYVPLLPARLPFASPTGPFLASSIDRRSLKRCLSRTVPFYWVWFSPCA